MAYEIQPGGNTGQLPRAPWFFNSTGRIFQMLPNEPAFAHPMSVILDPKTEHIGIDTNDDLPEADKIMLGHNGSIGILRVLLDELAINGFVVDLRYTTQLAQRELGFETTLFGQPAEMNERCRAVPVLGALFIDSGTGLVHFPHHGGRTEDIEPFAISLMQYVDSSRQVKGVEVVGGQGTSQQPEQIVESARRDAQ